MGLGRCYHLLPIVLLSRLWVSSSLSHLLLLLVSQTVVVVVVVPVNAFQCATGRTLGELEEIPTEWMNDGYCDCPIDGADEPNTDACSGSQFWPGIVKEDKEEDSSPRAPVFFVCPQQPNLKLPLSRLDDGICDCCDGKDEPNGVVSCRDNCEEMLRAERDARAKLEHDFQKGLKKRQSEIEQFQTLRQTKLQQVEELETKLNKEVIPSIEDTQTQIRDLKQEYVKSRVSTMKDGVSSSSIAQELLAPLDKLELEQFIIHACQMAGEILVDEDTTTCAPLRVAGLDIALTWSDDNYDKVDEMNGNINMTAEMVQLIFNNAVVQGGTLKWSTSTNTRKKKHRRRLDEIYHDDDDYLGDHYDRYNDDYDDTDNEPPYHNSDDDDDDYDGDDDDYNEPMPEPEGKEKELIDAISSSTFSKTRNTFLSKANMIASVISKIVGAPLDGETDNDDKGNHLDESEDNSAPSIDPAAYTMVRNELMKKVSSIQKGLQWGASAKLLFSFSNQSENNLLRLAIGTIYYGQLSALDVWQILQGILPEFNPSSGGQDDTCGSPWANSCPPKTIDRSGVPYPPSILINVATTFCENEATGNMNDKLQNTCAAQQQEENSAKDTETISIPTSVPEGFLGYSAPTKRTEDDPLSIQLFGPIDSLATPKEELKELEDKKRNAENEKRNLERSIDDIWKDIGGKDGKQMGENGELHSMADQCYSVVAGKYTYETCIFGRASQKEGSGGGGTNLGNWRGMERDAESGRRVMKWEGGAKCWNGPQRSAAVYVTCGADHKLLSADEPDTCRYVLEMESPIGCDEDYKIRMGL
ncbi:glucosidase II [Nitzschia inconspicua]|uniref:Glucosidase II n=1 Tax=Nitzschia inconspicua TaxID=303405 RepID=A0A9K3M4C4_9STRA|nr:glucosidase II [Nitzschia inconspicua]